MKIITLLLMIVSINVAQAEIYKCPGKLEGQYTYQATPCKGAKADEHTLKVIPYDEKKAVEAQAKLAKEIEAGNAKKEPAAVTKTVEMVGKNASPQAVIGSNVAVPPAAPAPAPMYPAPQNNAK